MSVLRVINKKSITTKWVKFIEIRILLFVRRSKKEKISPMNKKLMMMIVYASTSSSTQSQVEKFQKIYQSRGTWTT